MFHIIRTATGKNLSSEHSELTDAAGKVVQLKVDMEPTMLQKSFNEQLVIKFILHAYYQELIKSKGLEFLLIHNNYVLSNFYGHMYTYICTYIGMYCVCIYISVYVEFSVGMRDMCVF